MSGQLPTVTLECRVTDEPQLRFTPAGVAVCNFTGVMQDRRKDENNVWSDVGEPLWVRVNCWRQLGENVAESVAKGDEVVVIGKLSTRSYDDKEGNKRQSLEVTAFSVGVALRFRTVKHGSGKAERGSTTAEADPWASAAPAPVDEPPF